MMTNKHTVVENVALKTLTYTITPAVVLMLGMIMILKGRFREAFSYVSGDWREPL